MLRLRLASDRVALLAARVRAGLEYTVRVARHGADAAEAPLRRHHDVVPALAQACDRRLTDAFLDSDVPRQRLARVEARRERLRVMVRRVDRGLEIEAEVDVAEESVERPLILLVAARGACREVRLAFSRGHGRRERRARS